ncbi:MAG: MBL fold metallo-hydrolase [Myxococcales bacterium]|nr:MBL fold metallo-hydrolase [Myxococcales bacterium]
MHIQFQGAADQVTGSLHRLQVGGRDILLDCGLYQGHRAEANRLNRELPDWAARADCLVLSHAHLDHSGNIPTLVKRGFRGNVYCTPPTRDLCSVMLRDAAMIAEQDARYLNRRNARDGIAERIAPLYTVEDASAAMDRMISVPLHRKMPLAPGVELTFHNSGHVLGSALVQLDLREQGRSLRLLFTGDLGREELPLLSDPEIVKDVDFLITESTYGDRLHPEISEMDDQLGSIVRTTIDRGGRVYIPTFALERAQEVLFSLERLHERGALPRVPIYIDSPLAIAITEIYKLHPEGLAHDVRDRILGRDDPFSPPGLQYVSEVEDSKELQRSGESCIIIAGSGMCEAGRIVHHFVRALGEPKNSVVIVGFMAQHTLGRRLVERRREVKVLGVPRDVNAQIHVINGLSAHADQRDLVDFAKRTARVGNLRRIAMVHGEPKPRTILGELLKERTSAEVIDAKVGLRVEL